MRGGGRIDGGAGERHEAAAQQRALAGAAHHQALGLALELRGELQQIFRSRTRAEWVELFIEHDVAGAPVYLAGETHADAHFTARDLWLDPLRDGLRNTRIAVAELLDGAPRNLDSADVHPLVPRLADELERHYPGHSVQVRETGRFVRANLVPQAAPEMAVEQAQALLPEEDAWRLIAVGRLVPDLHAAEDTATSGGGAKAGDGGS